MATPYRSKRRKFSFATPKKKKSQYSSAKIYKPKRIRAKKSRSSGVSSMALLTAIMQNNFARQMEEQIQKDDGGALGALLSPVGSLLGDVKDTVTGIPFGLMELGKAGGSDIKDLVTDQSFTGGSDLGRMGRGIVEDYKHRYGDLSSKLITGNPITGGLFTVKDLVTGDFGGALENIAGKNFLEGVKDSDWGSFAKKVEEHPLGYILDAATAVGGGANVAAKLGRTGKLGESLQKLSQPGTAKIGHSKGSGEAQVLLSHVPSKRWSQKAILGVQRRIPTIMGKNVPLITGDWKYNRLDQKVRAVPKQAAKAKEIHLAASSNRMKRKFKESYGPISEATLHAIETPNFTTEERVANFRKTIDEARAAIKNDDTMDADTKARANKHLDFQEKVIPMHIAESSKHLSEIKTIKSQLDAGKRVQDFDGKQRVLAQYVDAVDSALKQDAKNRNVVEHDGMEQQLAESEGMFRAEPLDAQEQALNASLAEAARRAGVGTTDSVPAPSRPSSAPFVGKRGMEAPRSLGWQYSVESSRVFNVLGKMKAKKRADGSRAPKIFTAKQLAAQLRTEVEDAQFWIEELESAGAIKKDNLRSGSQERYRVLDQNAIRRAKRTTQRKSNVQEGDHLWSFATDIHNVLANRRGRKTVKQHKVSIEELDKVSPQTFRVDSTSIDGVVKDSLKPFKPITIKPHRTPHLYAIKRDDAYWNSFRGDISDNEIKEWQNLGFGLDQVFKDQGVYDRLVSYHRTPKALVASLNVSNRLAHIKYTYDRLSTRGVVIGKGSLPPKGMTYLRKPTVKNEVPQGSSAEAISENAISAIHTSDPNLALEKDGGLVAVPMDAINELKHEVGLERWHVLKHVRKAQYLWKTMILSMRPGFVTGNIVGNTILVLANQPGAFHHLMRSAVPGHRQPRLDTSLKKYYPQHQTTFGDELREEGAEFEGWYQKIRPLAEIGFTVSSKFENWLREGVLFEAAMRHSPAFKEAWKSSPNMPDDLRFNKAFDAASKIDPEFQQRVGDSLDNIMGDYHSYSRHEDLVRLAIPFYGWFRHITRNTVNMAQERPVVTNALANLGLLGQEKFEDWEKEFTGGRMLPDFMETYLPIGGGVLDTKNLNPYATIGELTQFKNLVSGDAGSFRAGSTMLSPFVTGTLSAITGQSALTGAKLEGSGFGALGDLVKGTATGFPLVQALGKGWDATHGEPTPGVEELFNRDGSPKEERSPMLAKTGESWLSSFLGLPLKDVDPETAANFAEILGQGPEEDYFKIRDIGAMADPEEIAKRKKKAFEDKMKKLRLLAGVSANG